ncbi:MAG: heme o synthase [Flavobacterium sp.]
MNSKNTYQIFKELTKSGLSLSVVFSSLAGYLLGITSISEFDFITFLYLFLGGYAMVGASNVFNQVIEKDLDKLMIRTQLRPLPNGDITQNQALILGFGLSILGLIFLFLVNPTTAMFGAISLFLYTSVYTPLKTITSLSVFVGAFPGAIPFMLGWVAATGNFSLEAGTLFMIQFFWQFPHFWAIGWFLFEDYEKAGFFMLPTGKKDKTTAMQIILYTIWLIVASLLPAFFEYFGIISKLKLSPISAILILILGLGLLYYAIQLYQKKDDISARKLMLNSVFYITGLQIIYILDKFLIS